MKGFLCLEHPFLYLVSQTARPRDRGRPLTPVCWKKGKKEKTDARKLVSHFSLTRLARKSAALSPLACWQASMLYLAGRRFAHQHFADLRESIRANRFARKKTIFEDLGQIRANRVFSRIRIEIRDSSPFPKGAQTMKCKLWTETLEISRLKMPNSRFALHGLAPP